MAGLFGWLGRRSATSKRSSRRRHHSATRYSIEGWRQSRIELLERRHLLAIAAIGDSTPEPLWQAVGFDDASPTSWLPADTPAASGHRLNIGQLRSLLAQAPHEQNPDAAAEALVIAIPMPTEGVARFRIVESPIMAPELAAKFPTIKTFAGQGVDDPSATIRCDITPAGFHAQVLSAAGGYYIDPWPSGGSDFYASYYARAGSPVEEAVREWPTTGETDFLPGPLAAGRLVLSDAPEPLRSARSGTQLRTYRLAVAATGEYTAFHGGTVLAGQAAIVTAINRVGGIYERDLSVRLELVANNDLLVYTDGSTDPYTNTDSSLLVTQNQTNIDAVIGNANYDIGHVFSTGGGGLAYLGVVGYTDWKARGATGISNPTGDSFYVDYVAHEMGHQFNARHTFNVPDSNRDATAAYEPGSGSTIMAYAGLFGANNLQTHSDDYFHSKSFDEIIAFVDATISTVGTRTSTGNNIPVVDAGANYTIPARTPFVLTATGSDPDGDTLTYCWEERDLGPAQSLSDPDNGSSPLFRSFSPTTTPTRYFPRLANLLNNTASVGEKLPTTNRMLNFRVTARDNRSGGGGVNTDDVQLTVVDTGAPFQVTSPNSAVTWTGGTTQTVTWNVAGTTANGINASSVDILLSTDGGNTYSVLLASDTPNDGAQDIVVPNTASTTARIKVQPVENVFFDVSDYNFTVQQGANNAPVLDSSGVMSLAAITEDDTANSGTLVSAIIASGGGDRITDPDPGALEGIAVISVVNSNGDWQYSIDGGANWLSFGAVGGSAARLLASDSQTRIRFVPGANFEGTVDPGIRFRAWDRTSGVSGGVADTLINGGETPFSSETESALITVTGVNDAPVLDPSGNMSLGTIAEDSLPGNGTLVSAIIASAGGERITDVDLFAQTGIAVIGVDNTSGTWEFSIDAGGSWLPMGSPTAGEARLLAANVDTRVRFLPNPNYSGTVDPGLTFRAWDVTVGVNGGTADASTGGGASAFSLATETASITVTGVNDAPQIIAGGAMSLLPINEDDRLNTGTAISELIVSGGNRIFDPDGPTVPKGIAVTAVNTSKGDWQFTTNGTSWQTLSSPATNKGLLLAADSKTRVRFRPTASSNYSGTIADAITFRAWDTTAGSNGSVVTIASTGGTSAYSTALETAFITILDVNDAPVLNNSGTMTLNPINEDDTTNGGTLVSEIILSAGGDRITDIDPDALEGIAIINADIGNGSWQFSIDGGSTWSDMPQPSSSEARLLAADARIRFVPVANYFGTVGNALTFRAWDQSTGTNGGTANPGAGGGSTAFSSATETADLTVNPINDAPLLNTAANPVLPDVPEDAADPAGQSLPQIVLAGTITDADGVAVQAIAITAVDDLHGTWQYQAVGTTTWTQISASPTESLLLDPWYKIRFVPVPDFFGTATFTFRAWDKTAGFAGGTANTTVNGGATPFSIDTDTASVVVIPVNDAPILSTIASPRLTDIPANVFDSAGDTIGTVLIDGSITDPDGVAVEAIAVTAVDNAHGTWQYQLTGQSTWANIVASATSSLLLGAADRVRFTPGAGWSGEATFTFRAWDQSTGAPGSLADSSTNGGTTAFSFDTDTVSVTVLPAAQNQAPVLDASYDPALSGVIEDTADPVGDTVGAIVVDGSISDPDGAAVEAIAVTAVDNSHGRWEYQLSGQATWTVLIATSTSSLLLGPADKVRFVPAQDFSGSATFTFRAWDQSTGSAGATADTSVNGGTTAFSAATDMAAVAVLGANDAPVLNPAGAMSLAAIDEDNTANAGTLVAAIIDSAGVDQITDADPDAVEGIAVIAADSTHGFWQFSTDGGGNWQDMGSPTATAARLLAADASTRVRFVPSADFSGTIGNGLTFAAWDRTSGSSGGTGDAGTRGGATAFSEGVKTASIVVNAVNDAPMLDSSGDTSLATINEDDISNAGTLISAMIASAGGDRITDVDTDAVEGVAITGASSAYGSWQYSTNNGGNWLPLGTPTVAAARLLAADASTRIRFVPNADFNGLIDSAITFRAWDVTVGANGETADTGAGGGASAFSVDTETASIAVLAVNDAPLNTLPGNSPAVEDTPIVFTAPNTLLISDVDAGSSPVKVTLIAASGVVTLGSVAGLTFIEGDGVSDLTAVFTGTIAAINAAFDGMSFSPDSNYSGFASIRITTDDLGNTGSGGAKSDTDTLNISIDAINDAPVIVLPSAQTTSEDTPLVLSAAGGNLIAVTDIDAISYPVRVTLAAAHGVLTLNGTSGLTFTTGDGTADASLDFTGALASVNAALNGVTFSPAWNFVGSASITITANDQGNTGSGGSQIDSGILTIAVTPVNDAPVLDNTGSMSLAAIQRNAFDNPGTSVAAIIDSAGGDRITDVDAGALRGIAVTAVDNANGAWEFSTNDGDSWTGFGAPTETAARLLAADAQTRVRFVPNPDYVGMVLAGITFRAWDRTNGLNGGTADTSSPGGTSAFSLAFETASIAVDDVATLSLTIAAASISEGAGPGATTAMVTRNTDPTNAMVVVLSSSDPSEAQVLATVVIPAGQASASFAIDAVDDEIVDGTQVVTITAAAVGYVSGVDQLSVIDDDSMPVVGNASALLAENDTITFSAQQLSATDADNDAASLIFTLVSVPARGQLQRQGTALAAGSTFIQQDITDGKIAYAHDGSEEASDSFTFTVADPAGNRTAEHAFSVTITPVNDAPAVLSPLGDVFVEEDASDTLIALAGVFADVDPGDVLSYSVTVAHTIDSVVNDIRESSYKHFIEDQLYTRLGDNRGFGPQHDLARENIASYFAGLGLTTVQEPFQYNSQTYYNVVATKIGAVRPNDVYLVGAHYDSVNNPGADDNASGVAAVMELARVLSQYQFEATLCFVAFDREEQGLYGSTAYAAAHAADQIRGMISLDMIAYNPGGLNKVRLYDYVPGGEIKANLAAAFDAYGRGVTAVVETSPIGASDHRPFEQRGFDAALVIEHEVWSNPFYHKLSDSVDTLGYLDYQFASKVTGAVAGYLVTEAVLDDAPSLLTATIADGVLTLDYHENRSGSVWVTVRATDLSNAFVEDTFAVWVDDVNDAPVLDPGGSMSLADIDEDDTANNGTLISAIIASAGGDRITDVDAGALEGIAVVGASVVGGNWEFSTNNGLTWSAIGNLSVAAARLLAADSATRVRFVPGLDFNGTIDSALSFRAWDRTSGANGGVGDTTSSGGTSAFSTAIETASVTVKAVTDAPTVTAPVVAITLNADNYSITGSAEADSLVRIYRDLNNNSQIDAGDDPVGQQQLTGGGTAFAIGVSLVQNAANNFLVTATDAAGNVSPPADVPTITEDSQAPAGDIVDVSPDPRSTAVGIVTISFSEDVSGVNIADFMLTRNGVGVDISSLAVTGSGTSYTLDLSSVTALPGSYAFTLVAVGSEIQDAAGNALAADASDAWTMVLSTSTVVGRHIFYNNSYFDNNPAVGRDDDNAIARDKQALLPGQTATFAHYTSYSRGLNGIMIDFDDLPGTPTTADFQFKVGNTTTPDAWTAGPQPTVAIRRDVGAALVDRVVLVWPDAPNPGSISKQWLQVTVLANARTGLSTPDVFYFGNAVGDSGLGNTDTRAYVNTVDFAGARDNPHTVLNRALIDDAFDFNRDSLVNILDLGIARDNSTNVLTALKLFAVPDGVTTGLKAAMWLAPDFPSRRSTAGTVSAAPPADIISTPDVALGKPLSPAGRTPSAVATELFTKFGIELGGGRSITPTSEDGFASWEDIIERLAEAIEKVAEPHG